MSRISLSFTGMPLCYRTHTGGGSSVLSAAGRNGLAPVDVLAPVKGVHIAAMMASAISLVPTAVGSSRCGFMS